MENLVLINKQNMAHPVDASQLYEYLEIRHRFRDWINNRIEDYGFIENQDYAIVEQSIGGTAGGRPTKVYAISLDMAKELAMLEKTEKGKTIRRYFIEVENKMRNSSSELSLESKIDRLERKLDMIATNMQHIAKNEYKQLQNSTPIKENSITNYILPADKDDSDAVFMTPTEIANMMLKNFAVKLHPIKLGESLNEHGFIRTQKRSSKQYPEYGYYIRLRP